VNRLSPELLEEIVHRLVEEFHPERIILFGSHAWGTPSPDSDIDLLVVVPTSQSTPTQRAMRAHRALSGLGVPKDVMVRTREEIERYRLVPASLEAEILERGRPLYG
jgi:predicted nucleotidyltransferase